MINKILLHFFPSTQLLWLLEVQVRQSSFHMIPTTLEKERTIPESHRLAYIHNLCRSGSVEDTFTIESELALS